MGKLEVKSLSMAYGENAVLQDINLLIPEGRITALIGGNGSGKTTLLRILARLLKPVKGTAYLDGKAIHQMATKDVARVLGILPQSPLAPEGMTVRELVAQGRYPYQTWYRQWSQEDQEKVAWALEATGMTDMAERLLESLSGGQRQRAWISMALAQGTSILLLDEPTTYLDLAHQVEILDLLTALNASEHCTIVMVLHDLNQAARYADHLVVLKSGQVLAEGVPQTVISEELIQEAFGLECRIIIDPISETPLCLPLMNDARKQVLKKENVEHPLQGLAGSGAPEVTGIRQ